MAERCPGAEAVGVAVLPGYRFVINLRGYATVLPDKDAETAGLLWRLDASHEAALDRYEGYAKGLYDKCHRAVRDASGQECTALVYVDHRNTRIGPPNDGYLERIIDGAERHQLPASHLRMLKAWPRNRMLKAFNRTVNEVKSGTALPSFLSRHGEQCAAELKERRDVLVSAMLDQVAISDNAPALEEVFIEAAHRVAQEIAHRLESERENRFASDILAFERFAEHLHKLCQDEVFFETLESSGTLPESELAGVGIIITADPERARDPEDRFIVTNHAPALATLWARMFSGTHGVHPRDARFLEAFAEAARQTADSMNAGDAVRSALDKVNAAVAEERARLLAQVHGMRSARG